MLKAFCVNCGKFTECSIIVQEEESNVRGTSFRYSNTVPICNACRNEVYIASINDANVDAQLEAYRKAKGEDYGT